MGLEDFYRNHEENAMLAPIKKLVVAVVGLVILIVNRQWGLDLADQEALMVDGIIAGLTALGVWGFRNTPE